MSADIVERLDMEAPSTFLSRSARYEIIALRARLAEAERERNEAATGKADREHEIVGLNVSLAEAKRELDNYQAREIARAALAPAKTDPECTDCGGTGMTYQTERRCSCQPAAPGGKP